jgi:vacuolar protein-sorting-associated protein 4
MQPVRKVLSATHFKQVNDDGKAKWTPCSPGDPAAQEKTWTDIESDELLEPPLKVNDFLKSLETTRPTVTADDIRKHDEWTKDSGAYHTSLTLLTLIVVYILRRRGSLENELMINT